MKEKRLKVIVEGRISSGEMGDIKGGCDCGCEPNPCESLKAYSIFNPIEPCAISLTKYAIIIDPCRIVNVDPCIRGGYYCAMGFSAEPPCSDSRYVSYI